MGKIYRSNADTRSRVLLVFGVALSSLLLSWSAVAQVRPPSSPQPPQPKAPATLQPPPRPASAPPIGTSPSVARELQPRLVSFELVSASGGLPATEQSARAIVVLAGMESARDVSIRLEGCGWSANPHILRSRPNAENGEVRDTIPGVLTASGCSLDVLFTYAAPPTFQTRSRLFTLRTPPVVTMPRKTVRLTSFDQISRLMQFRPTGNNLGACSGFSDFGAGRFAVGMASGSQGRFTFAIRSGPIGTHCHWLSSFLDLPTGVVLTKIDTTAYSDNQTGPKGSGATCRVHDFWEGNAAAAVDGIGELTRGTMFFPITNYDWEEYLSPNKRGYPPLVLDNLTLVSAQSAQAIYRSWMLPMRIGLQCDATALNDHYVTVTVNEMVFSVPEAVSFP